MDKHTYTSRDLVERLRPTHLIPADWLKAMAEAADRIEQLEAENARLREALQWYAKDYDYENKSSQWDGGCIARQALGDKTND
jgi:truncated hemoglobin YjbI